jgi:transcriptional regulator GlxA family with amidase domain
MIMRRSTSRHIVFTANEGVSLLDLSGPLEDFRVAAAFARPQGRGGMYECTVVSARGGRVKTADGVELNTKSVRSLARKAIDTLIVPGAFVVDDVTATAPWSNGSRRTLLHANACVRYVLEVFYWLPQEFLTRTGQRRTRCTRRCWPVGTPV